MLAPVLAHVSAVVVNLTKHAIVFSEEEEEEEEASEETHIGSSGNFTITSAMLSTY